MLQNINIFALNIPTTTGSAPRTIINSNWVQQPHKQQCHGPCAAQRPYVRQTNQLKQPHNNQNEIYNQRFKQRTSFFWEIQCKFSGCINKIFYWSVAKGKKKHEKLLKKLGFLLLLLGFFQQPEVFILWYTLYTCIMHNNISLLVSF